MADKHQAACPGACNDPRFHKHVLSMPGNDKPTNAGIQHLLAATDLHQNVQELTSRMTPCLSQQSVHTIQGKQTLAVGQETHKIYSKAVARWGLLRNERHKHFAIKSLEGRV